MHEKGKLQRCPELGTMNAHTHTPVLWPRFLVLMDQSEMEAFVNQHKARPIKRQVMPLLCPHLPFPFGGSLET